MQLTMEQMAVACLALHVIADYTLQGCLADLKQRSWWDAKIEETARSERNDTLEKQASARRVMRARYGNDYKAALWCHGLMWSALTFLPLCAVPGWSAVVAVNAAFHVVVDDLKANRAKINLIDDQCLHALQIGVTLGAYWLFKCLAG